MDESQDKVAEDEYSDELRDSIRPERFYVKLYKNL